MMLSLIDKRNRMKEELFENRFKIDLFKDNPNVKGTRPDGKVHKVYSSMRWEKRELVWLVVCSYFVQERRGFSVTEDSVSCKQCLKRLEVVP